MSPNIAGVTGNASGGKPTVAAAADVFSRIRELLDRKNISYTIKEHPPTPTSEDSARERNEPLRMGAKALVLKADDRFVLIVLPGDRRVDGRRLKSILQCKNLRFASREELQERTGLEPGAVPPLGSLFQLPTLVDEALLQNKRISFNAGSLTKSITLQAEEYVRALAPTTCSFTAPK